jgi:heavy metal sensor kinase
MEPGHDEKKYPGLVLTVGASHEPVVAKLRALALVLTFLSLSLWLLAAFLGRLLCRRALLPVTHMAETAHAMSAADLDQRLPTPGTEDELDGLGKAFNDLLTRLQESFERQQRFTGDASHQLRTPLTARLGQVEVALRRERSSEEYRRVLHLVKEQADGMRQIVDMLLFLARADAESYSPQLEALSLTAWLPEHLVRWSGHARAADLRLEGPEGDSLWANVQAPLLAQLVDNLLDNACKYSDPGTLITLRLARDAGTVSLTITDAGRGIPSEDLPHLFEPFYRSAEARRLGVTGVGLGLAVAQRIAVAFGGSLTAQSGPVRGASFTLRLPEPA